MEKLFNPQGVAVIGASRHKEKLGYQILDNLKKSGFKGQIYPVNPDAVMILNLKVYSRVNDIPAPIDLAIIIVPAKIVPEVLADCVKKDIPYVIVISAGFSELGEEGKILQEKIKKIIEGTKTRLIGPNCLGVFNTAFNFNATFAAPKLIKGNVSVIFQSGALGSALFDWANRFGFGFAKFVSLGNKVDLDETELIEYLRNDPETKVIVLYLEEIKDQAKFLSVCRLTSAQKPIIILKGGTTNLGAKAAFSHTAAMVNTSHTTKAIFAQANLIVAKTIEEMLNLIQVLSTEPPMLSNRIFIITNAGGAGILATDMADQLNLQMPLPSSQDIKQLRKVLPAVSSIANPLDLTGEAKALNYEKALNYALQNPNYDAVLVLLTPQTATEVPETAKILANLAQTPKPILASFLGDQAVAQGEEILRQAGVPYFEDPELAVYALYKVYKYWQKRHQDMVFIDLHPNQNIKIQTDVLALAQSYNIPVPPSGMATNYDVAINIAKRIGFPVAAKNIDPKVVHKFKAGKVVLNIPDLNFLQESLKKIGFPVIIQRMVEAPFEVIIGAKRDPQLGFILTFGWGGVFTEDIADFSARVFPLTEGDLEEMIKETKMGKVLVREKVDLSPLKNILIEVGQIMVDFPEIAEFELNPVKVSEHEAICVDARYKNI